MKSKQNLSDIRAKSPEERTALVAELREKFRLARVDLQKGKTKNPAEARRIRKDIARILTVNNNPTA